MQRRSHYKINTPAETGGEKNCQMEVEPQPISTLDGNLCDGTALACGNHFEFRNYDMVGSSEEIRKVADRVGENGGEYEDTDHTTEADAAVERCSSDAAMKLQKAYRGYRTRRMLADSAVVAEELWWQVLDFARLSHSTISFFNFSKPETAASRWNRISLNASKVGKGLSADAKAQKLAFQHWIEAIDPRHRYGHSLHYYFDEWSNTNSGQPFFYWLDIGDGKEVDLKECPRSKLRKQRIKYLGQKEREHYEIVVIDGRISYKLTGKSLDTNQGSRGSKWIFVMSTSKRLYVGEKQKGLFHHSSFLAGGATLASGRLIVEGGLLKEKTLESVFDVKCISAYSGHYKPTDESLDIFLAFLNENGVNLDEVKILKGNEDPENNEYGKHSMKCIVSEVSTSDSIPCDLPNEEDQSGDFVPCDLEDQSAETILPSKLQTRMEYKRSLSGGLRSPKTDVPQAAILQRINSKKSAKSYQLGNQLPTKWSTGTGPRIGCIADYPVELRLQALELTNLSPRTRTSSQPWTSRRIDYLSPRSTFPGDLGNIDAAAIDLKL